MSNNVATTSVVLSNNNLNLEQDVQQSYVNSALLYTLTQGTSTLKDISDISNTQVGDIYFPFDDDSSWDSMTPEEKTLLFWSILSYLHTIVKDCQANDGGAIDYNTWHDILNHTFLKVYEKLKKLSDQGICSDIFKQLHLDQISHSDWNEFTVWMDSYITTDPNKQEYINSWAFAQYKLEKFLKGVNFANIDFSSMNGATDAFAILEIISDIANNPNNTSEEYKDLKQYADNLLKLFLSTDGQASHNLFVQALAAYFYKKEGGDWTKVKADLQSIYAQLSNPNNIPSWAQTLSDLNTIISTMPDDFKKWISTNSAAILQSTFEYSFDSRPEETTTTSALTEPAASQYRGCSLAPILPRKMVNSWIGYEAKDLLADLQRELANKQVNKN